MRITSSFVLTAYIVVVPAIGSNFGVPPLYTTSIFALLRSSVPSIGICDCRTASCACGVPGTDTRTEPRGLDGGMRAKSDGRLDVANVHGPSRLDAENHRPETRK